MIKAYFINSFRKIWKNKTSSVINIIGLSIGISVSMTIFLIVSFDFSFEDFQKNRNQIHRIVTDMKAGGELTKNSGVPYPLHNAVMHEFRGIQNLTSFYLTYEQKVTIPNSNTQIPQVFKRQTDIIFADEEYFNVFSFYKWAAGSPYKSFKDPFQVVLTQERSLIYFPGLKPTEIIGKQILYNDSIKATVVGIVNDEVRNTDFSFKEFISQSTIFNTGLKETMGLNMWANINSSSQLFLILAPGSNAFEIERQFGLFDKKIAKEMGLASGNSISFHLQKLKDIHFDSEYDNFNQRQANKSVLISLTLIGFFLLFLACINYINLNSAIEVARLKETGIRKILGAGKKQLMIQLFMETFLLTLISVLISMALVPIFLQIFSEFIPRGLIFSAIPIKYTLAFIGILMLVVTLASGFYPALILSNLNPVAVLKNQILISSNQTQKSWLRKTLTVSQFIVANALILATIIVSKQINFALTKNIGFRKDAIIYFDTPMMPLDSKENKVGFLFQKYRSFPEIEAISLGADAPASISEGGKTVKYIDGNRNIETEVQFKYGDSNFIPLYKFKILAGRNLLSSDTIQEYVINETYAHILGFRNPNDAIGKLLGDRKRVPIVGVISDFHQKSIHTTITPLIITSMSQVQFTFHIALKPNNASGELWKNGISKLENAFKQAYPDEEFKLYFLDQSIGSFYKSEENTAKLLRWGTGFAILISCLGLIGLAIFTTQKRAKEIGLRKILGASFANILLMQYEEYFMLVLLSFTFATPISLIIMSKWLQNYAYRINISPWMVLLSGLVIFIIALITVSIQSIKISLTQPIKTLREG